MSEDHLGVFKRGFSHLLGLQLGSRVVTFLLNLLVVRRLSPSVYGLAAFRLPLLNASVLLLSREAFRRGCLRKTGLKKQSRGDELRSVLPLALLPIPCGLIITSLCFSILGHSGGDSAISGALIGEHVAAIVIELLSEPLYIVGALWLEFGLRARVEGTAVLVKSTVTFFLIRCTSRDAALAFADAQIVYAAALLLGYSSLLPRIIALNQEGRASEQSVWKTVDWKRVKLSAVFFVQTCERLVLAEGSKFVLMRLKSLYDEGVYGLVNNLGSLVVRIVFQPFEETAFTTFSRVGAAKGSAEMGRLAIVLAALIRAVSMVGLLAVIFGPPSSSLFLQLLYSDRWSHTEAPNVLVAYCLYIAFMALNGICEAFVHAVADEKALGESNLFMLVSASLHMVASIALVQTAGAVGLVAADALNMFGRIIYALWCIRRYFKGVSSFSVASICPHKETLMTGTLISATLFAARHVLCEASQVWASLAYIGTASILLCGMLWALWRIERPTWTALMELKQPRESSKKD